MSVWAPTRPAALDRLSAFCDQGLVRYAARRNLDPGPTGASGVSQLSPWLRRRMLTEAEVCAAALQAQPYEAVDKFIAEVCWRTYWKGWLEQRPAVWSDYRAAVSAGHAQLAEQSALRRRYREALGGNSGIACFDAWTQELLASGYLHNHTRMWWASIWIFTLRLPWALGAEFFLQQLLDGDPASNTLSWRWVGGLHTRGKHYLARAENIARFTAHRFDPRGELDESAAPLPADELPAARALNVPPAADLSRPSVLLLHEDELHAESLLPPGCALRGVAVLAASDTGSAAGRAERVREFAQSALHEAAARAGAHFRVPAQVLGALELPRWAAEQGAQQVLAAHAPVGDEAERLPAIEAAVRARGLGWGTVLRPWDAAFWPHCNRGFFQVRDRIPALLRELGIAA